MKLGEGLATSGCRASNFRDMIRTCQLLATSTEIVLALYDVHLYYFDMSVTGGMKDAKFKLFAAIPDIASTGAPVFDCVKFRSTSSLHA